MQIGKSPHFLVDCQLSAHVSFPFQSGDARLRHCWVDFENAFSTFLVNRSHALAACVLGSVRAGRFWWGVVANV